MYSERYRASRRRPTTDHPKEDDMAAKFEWYQDKAKKFRFRLKAANGQIIATSEAYNSKDSCMNGIESVKSNAPKAEVVETKE